MRATDVGMQHADVDVIEVNIFRPRTMIVVQFRPPADPFPQGLFSPLGVHAVGRFRLP